MRRRCYLCSFLLIIISVQFGHFVVMNLHTGRAYCLPDGYEIIDSSLDDVKKCLHPSFTPEDIKTLTYKNTALARDVHGLSSVVVIHK